MCQEMKRIQPLLKNLEWRAATKFDLLLEMMELVDRDSLKRRANGVVIAKIVV